jgi:phosphatidylinositol glycan class V
MAAIFRLFLPSWLISTDELLIVVGLLISNILFVFSAYILNLFCRQIGLAPRDTQMAIIIFCFNPASVFFSAVYTESMYAFFSFSAVLLYEKGYPILSAMPLKAFSRGPKHLRYPGTGKLVALVAAAAPYLLWGGFVQTSLSIGNNSPAISVYPYPPSFLGAYSHLQRKHWNVGFLRQYEFNQLPNFLIALPTIIVVLNCACQKDGGIQSQWRHRVHLITLVVIGITIAHVQITTRLVFASSPILPVLIALSLHSTIAWQRFICIYFIVYASCGIILHANFFPMT